MKPVSSCRLRRASFPSLAASGVGIRDAARRSRFSSRERTRAEGPVLASPSGVVRLSPDWSSVSSGCRRTSHFSLLAHCAAGAARTAKPARRAKRRSAESREVTKRNGTRTCRPHDEAVRVRKYWPGWVEGASLRLQPNPRDPTRVPQAAGPSSACRQERASTSKAQRSALRCAAVELRPVLGRRGGAGKARRVARMDSGQFAASTGMCCQRTPEPSRVVGRLHRTTDPSGCAFFGLRFFAQTKKGNSRAGRREKRFAILAVAIEKVRRGSRVIRLSSLATAEQSEDEVFATVNPAQGPDPHPYPSPGGRGENRVDPQPRPLSRRERGEGLRTAAQKREARG